MRPPEEPPRTTPRSAPLEIQVSYRLGAPLIYVAGELDHDTAGRLRAAIDEELADRPEALLLECSGLAYVDSGGLSLLFETARRFADGGWLGIVAPNENVRRLIDLTGLTERDTVRVIDDLKEASAALAGPSV
jgi:stage II sporulation protein AA (anti-sigma F factor antagonist)